MSKPWGGIGAWAAEAEREEAEEKERAAALAAVAPAANFPSLKDSVKQPKKKKMSLSEFNAVGGRDSSLKGLIHHEMMRLPTGPKERSTEEMQYGRLGGGFSSYGGGGRSGGTGGAVDMDREGSWGGNRRSYGGGFEEDLRGSMQSRVSDFEPSRADEVDNWTAGKKPIAPARSSAFGSGFRHSGPDSGKWQTGGTTFSENNGQERTRLVLEPRRESNANAGVTTLNKPSPFGAARPREEVLAGKGLDWKKLDSEIEGKGLISRPSSSQSSRPNSAQSSRSENVSLQGGVEAVVKPKPKVNPFGDAKPREVLLEEKGKDWRKIDMELERRADRPETEEENILKEEINRLKKLEKEPYSQETGPNAPNMQGVIKQKENELKQLARELDDKIRFRQKVSERPGSGAGRLAGSSDRPPSRTGSVDEPKNTGFVDRPRLRGTAEVWSRSGDDRQSFQGRRERGFLGNRDMDRKKTGDTW